MTDHRMRDVLDRLSRGEITADQADRDLAGLGDAPAGPSEPESGPETGPAPAAVAMETPPDPARVSVRATMNGSGPLTVVGEHLLEPEVRGPASATVDRDGGGFVVYSHYADGTVLAVPAQSDLTLEVNGSSVVLHGLEGTLHGTFNVSEVVVGARLTRGASKITANTGPLVVLLAAGSDVKVLLRTACNWTVDPRITEVRAGKWILGTGRATLEIDGHLGQLDLIMPADE